MIRKRIIIIVSLLWMLPLLETFGQGEMQTFYLRDGSTIQGKIIAQDDSTLLVETKYGALEVIRRSSVLKKVSANKFIAQPFDGEERIPFLDESYSNAMLHLRIIEVKSKVNAEQALSRLKNGESFENVAIEISTAPNHEKGGDIGEICFDDLRVDFKKSLEGLREGEYSGVIDSDSTYFIIQLVKKMGECNIRGPINIESSKPKVGNVCSVCGAPAIFWCPVQKAWFCDEHAGKAYTPGGYYYICK